MDYPSKKAGVKMNPKHTSLIFPIIALSLALLIPGCASTSVKRVSADKQIDVSGNWNDTDIRIVCESLIDECVESRVITNYKKKNGKLPVVKLGEIMNLSDEHIDTSIIAGKFRNAIINSGELKFVSSDSEVDSLRSERMSQEDFASSETASSLTNETGADFMLLGTLKTVVDSEGKTMVKTYYVNVELHDIETSEILWSAENSEIKKVITRAKVKK